MSNNDNDELKYFDPGLLMRNRIDGLKPTARHCFNCKYRDANNIDWCQKRHADPYPDCKSSADQGCVLHEHA